MNSFQDINWGLIVPLVAIHVILAIVSLIDLSKREDTRGPKLMWVPIVIFVQIFGPVVYFIVGRRNG